MNWMDEEPYPGPPVEPVGWATIDGKEYPVYGFQLTSIPLPEGNLTLTAPKTLANGDTFHFSFGAIDFTT